MRYKILPHCAIILSGMYFVFYCIDRVNEPMAFIDNGITKSLLLILGMISVLNAISLIHIDRARYRQRQLRPRKAARPTAAHPRGTWDAPARPASRGTRESGSYAEPRAARRRDDWRYS